MSSKNTITKRCFTVIQDEALTAAALLPGTNVVRNSANKFAAGTATATSMKILIEDELQGKVVSETYASGARAQARTYRRGDLVLVMLKAEESVVIGDGIEPTAAGLFIKLNAGTRVATAREVLDLTGLANTLLLVEVD
jgi:hypothetical protein